MSRTQIWFWACTACTAPLLGTQHTGRGQRALLGVGCPHPAVEEPHRALLCPAVAGGDRACSALGKEFPPSVTALGGAGDCCLLLERLAKPCWKVWEWIMLDGWDVCELLPWQSFTFRGESPAHSRRLELDDLKGPFQPKPPWDSVTNMETAFTKEQKH